ncbi:MAG: acyl carrier protein [marine bacterium B5-7]|nr:MAG: acyl carrier protein [marine bacterium B5-7]
MNKEQIFEIVRRNIVDVLPSLSHHPIKLVDDLKSLGANSMDRMEIVVSSMEQLEVTIPLLELAKVANIDALVQILLDKKNVV